MPWTAGRLGEIIAASKTSGTTKKRANGVMEFADDTGDESQVRGVGDPGVEP